MCKSVNFIFPAELKNEYFVRVVSICMHKDLNIDKKKKSLNILKLAQLFILKIRLPKPLKKEFKRFISTFLKKTIILTIFPSNKELFQSIPFHCSL